MTTIVTTARDIDALKAENAALRDELESLRNTDVGEVRAENDEIWRENQRLRAEVERLK